jgi:hypothetical protein
MGILEKKKDILPLPAVEKQFVGHSSRGHNTDCAIPIPCSTTELKHVKSVRKLQSVYLTSVMVFDSVCLNVLPCSLHTDAVTSSHYVVATDTALYARLAKDVERRDRNLL